MLSHLSRKSSNKECDSVNTSQGYFCSYSSRLIWMESFVCDNTHRMGAPVLDNPKGDHEKLEITAFSPENTSS
jgi:hypothetical protein